MPRGVPMQWMASTYGHPPVFSADGKGAHFRCVDGHRYLDMGLALLVNFGGYAPAPVVSAVTRQLRRGSHFALPAEDAIYVAEELSHRFGLPSWQFTLSATLANAEAIRLARAATGRERILLFDGKYHGHLEQTMQIIVDGETRPEYLGLARDAGASTSIVQFNDLPAVEAMLAQDDFACVLTEPAMTLERTFLPEPGFHRGLRTLTRRAGTLLVLDETHTQTQHFGGLTRAWGLEPDIVVLGKSLGGGIPIGAYGMTKHLADVLEAPGGDPIVGYGEGQFVGEPIAELATGGTMFANALSMAAARAALEHLYTEEAYARTHALGARLADGMSAIIERRGLSWSVVRLFNRAGYHFSPDLPRNALDQRAAEDPELSDALRIHMLNQGVWEAGGWANPVASVAHTAADIERYLEVLDEAIGEVAVKG
jgi:glutamate-1-semialdehyde 2,1-aminomutase